MIISNFIFYLQSGELLFADELKGHHEFCLAVKLTPDKTSTFVDARICIHEDLEYQEDDQSRAQVIPYCEY